VSPGRAARFHSDTISPGWAILWCYAHYRVDRGSACRSGEPVTEYWQARVLAETDLSGPAGDALGEEGFTVTGVLADDVLELAEELE
jgi:hypothetical protein